MSLNASPATIPEFEVRFAEERSCLNFEWQARIDQGVVRPNIAMAISTCVGNGAPKYLGTSDHYASMTSEHLFRRNGLPPRYRPKPIVEPFCFSRSSTVSETLRRRCPGCNRIQRNIQSIGYISVRTEEASVGTANEADEDYNGWPRTGIQGRGAAPVAARS